MSLSRRTWLMPMCAIALTSAITGCAVFTNPDEAPTTDKNTSQKVPASTFTVGTENTSIKEGASVAIGIALSSPATATHTFTWKLLSAQDRFEASTGTVRVNSGESSAVFTLKSIDDSLNQETQSVRVLVEDTEGARASSQLDVVLEDNDPLPVLSTLNASGYRGATLTFPIKLSAPSGRAISFRWTTREISAVDGVDYKGGSGAVTLQAGQTSTVVSIPLPSGASSRTDKTFAFQLSTITGAIGGDTVATGTILAGSSLQSYVQFAKDSSRANENSGATSIEITLTQAVDRDVMVDYEVTGTASLSDHGLRSGRITITKGSLSATLNVPIANDQMHEASETVIVRMISSVNAGLGQLTTHTLFLDDDDAEPTVTVNDSSGLEGSDLIFNISLSSISGRDTIVTYRTRTDSAESIDFVESFGTVTLPAGTTMAQIHVPTNDDSMHEETEAFSFEIVGLSHATLARGVATGTIIDNDAAPLVSFATAASSVVEANASHAVTLRLSTPSGAPVYVPYTVSGTATPGMDHSLASGEVMIPAGTTEMEIRFNIFDDSTPEGTEDLVLEIGAPRGADRGVITRHTVTITDGD